MDKHVSGWGRGDEWKTLTILEDAGLSEDLPSSGSLGPLCDMSTPFPLRKGGQPPAHSNSGRACGSPAASWWACLGLTMSPLHASVPRLQSLSLSGNVPPCLKGRLCFLYSLFLSRPLSSCSSVISLTSLPPHPCWENIGEGYVGSQAFHSRQEVARLPLGVSGYLARRLNFHLHWQR